MFIITFAGYPITEKDMTTMSNRQRFLLQFAEKRTIYTLKSDQPFLFPTRREAFIELDQFLETARQLFKQLNGYRLRESVTFRKNQGRLPPIQYKYRAIIDFNTHIILRWEIRQALGEQINSTMIASSKMVDRANSRANFRVCEAKTFCHICRHEILKGVFYLKTGRLGICPQCLLDNAMPAQESIDSMDTQYVDDMLTERFLGKL